MTDVRNPPPGLDTERRRELGRLRAAIMAMPRASRAQLRLGPQSEPACGVCSAVAAGGYCGGGHEIEDYHDVSVLTLAELLDEDDLERVAELATGDAEPLVRALAGALAAERAITCYLLAGWKPEARP